MIVKVDPPVRGAGRPPRAELRARVLIIEGRFYDNIADELLAGATAALDAQGVAYERITVPGALEIPQVLAQVAVVSFMKPAELPVHAHSSPAPFTNRFRFSGTAQREASVMQALLPPSPSSTLLSSQASSPSIVPSPHTVG